MRFEIPALLALSTLVAGGQVTLYSQPDCKGNPFDVVEQKETGKCQEIGGKPASVVVDSTKATEFILVYSEPGCKGSKSGPFLGDNKDGKNCATGKSFEIAKV